MSDLIPRTPFDAHVFDWHLFQRISQEVDRRMFSAELEEGLPAVIAATRAPIVDDEAVSITRGRSEAIKDLVLRYRQGLAFGAVPLSLREAIEGLGARIFAADDPVDCLRILLGQTIEGAPPALAVKAMRIAIADEVWREVRGGKPLSSQWGNGAVDGPATRYQLSAKTIQNIFSEYRKPAAMNVALGLESFSSEPLDPDIPDNST